VFDVETFYPAKERMELALRVNGLLAAPGFDAWLHGEALDVQKLLYTDAGKPRIAIISIAHLNDAERMFVVTLIANELVAWMRRQSGTTSLRALFYMDEVFGYFPPSAMPPSKLPLLTLMKQARAFGIGVVLATQNPVDLDYKGLGNAGTWFIGRLQTDRDKQRVLEGLLGSEAAGGLDRAGYESLMSNLTQRTFLMRNVHDDAPVLFRTRWAMSYLRGPLTLNEIKRLTPRTQASASSPPMDVSAETRTAATAARTVASAATSARPVVQHGVTERFLVSPAGDPPRYRPHIGAQVRARYADAKAGLDTWQTTYYLAPVGKDGPDWSQAEVMAEPGPDFAREPAAGAAFADPPASVLSTRSHRSWSNALEDQVYRNAAVDLLACPSLKRIAAPGMPEGEFRTQLAQALREKRDDAVEALRKKYGSKVATLQDRERRAEQKVEREQAQASNQTLSSALSVGGSLLGALFGGGRRRASASKVSTAARSVGRASKERSDVAHAEADARAVREQIEALNAELEAEVARIESESDASTIGLDKVSVKPRKADITVEDLALVWSA
jgi:hypothetical protein